MDEDKLINIFYPQDYLRRKNIPLPDFQKTYDRLMLKGSKANLFFLWSEYKTDNPDGYQYSQFVEYFNRFVKEHYASRNVSMAVERIPEEKVYIDWVGDKPLIVLDKESLQLKIMYRLLRHE